MGIQKILDKYETLGIEEKPASPVKAEPLKAFIAHGGDSSALSKLKNFLEALGVQPLIVEEQPSESRSVGDKVNHYLNQANFVVILATGDDKIEDELHPRQNVIHEIGLAQKTHPDKIIYLLEDGATFPSNIRPKVWEPFKQDNMEDVFVYIVKELRNWGFLIAGKAEE